MLKGLGQGLVIGHFQKIPQHSLFVFQNCQIISIVFIFSWHHSKYPEKIETMFMQNFGGKTKSIMAFLKVTYRTLNLAISTENLDNVMTKFIIDKSTDP